MRKTTVECPSEKKKPTPTGLRPSWSSLRVVLSMAEMWSASKACLQAERVGQAAQGKDGRLAGGDGEQQAPARDVKQAYTAEESRQAPAFPAVEGITQQGAHGGHAWSLTLIAT